MGKQSGLYWPVDQAWKYQVHGARKKEKGDRALVKDKVRSKNRKVDCLLRHSF